MSEDDIDETLTKLMTSLDGLEQRYKKEEQDMTQQTSRDAGSDDEPRDPQGRWTSGGGEAVQHPDFMEGPEGSELAEHMDKSTDAMRGSLDAVDDARSALDAAAVDAENLAAEEDDILDEHGGDSKEYADWEKRNGAAMEKVADRTMAVHKAMADHIATTHAHMAKLTGRINKHAKANGVRGS